MISEEQVLILLQLISTIKESIKSLDEIIDSGNEKELGIVKGNIIKLNREIKENLSELKKEF